MRSVRANSKATKEPTDIFPAGHGSQPSDKDRISRIAESAYYKAEARGFSPGHELDDWLAAEAEEE
jgi:hypothetical protein